MSWWETGSKRLVIGDAPADAIVTGLKRLAPEVVGLPDLLSGLLAALGSIDAGVIRLSAKTSDGVIVASGTRDRKLDAAIANIVSAAAEKYEDELKRRASAEEIAACFTFVLGFEPERYLSQVKGLEIDEVTVEFAPS